MIIIHLIHGLIVLFRSVVPQRPITAKFVLFSSANVASAVDVGSPVRSFNKHELSIYEWKRRI